MNATVGTIPRTTRAARLAGKLLVNARQVATWRYIVGLAALVAVILALSFLPVPSLSHWRAWAESAGTWFPLLFVAVHAIVTILPVPRTLFTISSGILFGPLVGVVLCVLATTISAVFAFLLVRVFGRKHVRHRLTGPSARALDDRLRRRGWLAVGSLRLIAAVPFAVLNYACAVSSVRLWQYTAATAVGVVPGTVAVVLLGDALTGSVDPKMLAISAILLGFGVTGLLADSLLDRRERVRSRESVPVSVR